MAQTARVNNPGAQVDDSEETRRQQQQEAQFAQAVDQNFRPGYVDKDFWSGAKANAGRITAPLNTFQSQALPQYNYNPSMDQGQADFNRAQAEGFGAGQNQAALISALQAQAAGQGPSLAQLQLKQATDRNLAQSAGMLAGQRGINPALAARSIGQGAAAINQQAAGQSAMTRMEEQLAARQQLAGVLAQQRAAAGNQAQLGTGMFGAAGQLNQGQNTLAQQGQALNLQAQLANQQAQSDAAKANLLAEMEAQKIIADSEGLGSKVVGGVLGGASSLLTKFIPGAAHGAVVPGKPKVEGDSKKNDTVPAMLSPGEIVVPRSAAKDPDRAKAFVDEVLKKGKTKQKAKPIGYDDVLAKLQEIQEMMGKLSE